MRDERFWKKFKGVAMDEREGDRTEIEDLDEVEEWFSL